MDWKNSGGMGLMKQAYSRKNDFLREFPTCNREFKDLLDKIYSIIDLNTTILLMGESGVGKDRIAEAIHKYSFRADKNFIKIECATIPKDLFEAELFGYEKGAFTDAKETKKGRLELAEGGTLYLDEISALPLPTQAKILRVLEEKSFTRLGGNETIKISVRFICSTNADIYKLIEENKFRKDLFYRINVLSFKIPSLKERKDDISLLASIFLKEFSKEYEKNITAITKEALSILINKDWTGNVRELRNIIERAVILCNDKRIKPEDLPTDILLEKANTKEFFEKKLTLEEMEKEYIKEMLQFFKNNNTKTAKALGISRKTLILKRKKFGI